MQDVGQAIILQKVEAILGREMNEWATELKKLSEGISPSNNPVMSKLVSGLRRFCDARETIKRFLVDRHDAGNPHLEFDEEKKVRNRAVADAKLAVIDLENSTRSLDKLDASEEQRSRVNRIVDYGLYMARILRVRQELVLSMKNCDYNAASELVREGFEIAKMEVGGVHREDDIKYFRGHEMEIHAFSMLDDAKFWDVDSILLTKCERDFKGAVELLERITHTEEDKDTLCSIPSAFSHLLKFMVNPSTENLGALVEYRKLEETSSRVKKHFSPHLPKAVSERKIRAEKMAEYFKNTTMKIACWQIFNEIRYNAILIEEFVRINLRMIHELFRKAGLPDSRLKHYLPSNALAGWHVTIDRFIPDAKKVFPDLLPVSEEGEVVSSIVRGAEIWNDCKHEKFAANIFSGKKDDLMEGFMKRVLDNGQCLMTLGRDTSDFLKNVERQMKKSAPQE